MFSAIIAWRTYTLPTHAWGLGDPGPAPGRGWWLVAERAAHAVGSTVRTLHCCPDAATTLHTSLMKFKMRDAKGCCPTSPWGHGPLTPRTQGLQLGTGNGWFSGMLSPFIVNTTDAGNSKHPFFRSVNRDEGFAAILPHFCSGKNGGFVNRSCPFLHVSVRPSSNRMPWSCGPSLFCFVEQVFEIW